MLSDDTNDKSRRRPATTYRRSCPDSVVNSHLEIKSSAIFSFFSLKTIKMDSQRSVKHE